MNAAAFVVLCISLVVNGVLCKVYERCELARELRNLHEIPDAQLATWVCIARHESEYNTSAINYGSGDHGLLQISQLFWCSPPGYACGVSCDDMRNDDIEDDIICARRVYREHKRLSGDGFNAWVVYGLYCRDKTYANSFLEGCFLDGLKTDTEKPSVSEKPLPTINYYPQFTRKPTKTTKTTETTTETRYTTPTETATIPSTTEAQTTQQPKTTTFKPFKLTTTRRKFTTTTTIRKPTTRKTTIPKKTTLKPFTTRTTPIPKTTTKLLTTKKVDDFRTQKYGGGGGKKLRPTEENDEFTYAISKTGYKFTRF